ncbi:MAG: fused MFS/spermidine synthase, partial [Gemmataceae bacterium]
FFSFLSTCQGEVRIVPGDARLRLELEEDHSFDVLVLDAFSSDSIPIHLLTREALELYFSKLKEDGILLFHVSNRYLELPPLLARLAQSQSPPKRAIVDHDIPSEKQEKEGKTASTWMLLAKPEPIEAMKASDRRWSLVDANSGPLWTDAFSNLLGVWRREEP